MKKLSLVFLGTFATFVGFSQFLNNNVNLQEEESNNVKPKFSNTDNVVLHPVELQMQFLGISPNLRDLPEVDQSVAQIPITIKEDRDRPMNAHNPNALPQGTDPALQHSYPPPALNKALSYNWDGLGYSSVNPPDPTADVGPNHVVQMINGSSGARVRVYDKTGAAITGVTTMASLCGTTSGDGDPIVMYDERADRWFLSEFKSSGNQLLMAVSTTSDPTGSYYTYAVTSPGGFPDYPKYSIWEDAYVCTANVSSSDIFVFNRTNMLTGGAASAQFFTQPNFGTIAFQAGTPVSLNGTVLPPSGSSAMVMRIRDDAWSGSSSDALEIWNIDIDWVTPSNSSMYQDQVLPVSPYDSDMCGYTTFNCIPQPGTSQTIDPLREVLMNRIHYRNFGSHESIVCCHVTDVDGTDHAGVRWYELRRTSVAGGWSIYQEGTYAPDSDNRFMGSICISASGNIGLMYNVSSSSTYPCIRYTGRKECDPLNTMTEPETEIVAGGGSQGTGTGGRYGDYNQVGLDPSDGETFYGTAMYNPSSTWSTRIAAFSIDQCILAPEVSFDASSYTVDEPNTTASASACLDYQILNVPVSIAMAPSANADITINAIGGTATMGEDYTLNNTSFTLNGSNLTANVEVWVYNDAIVEGTETIQLGYTLNANGGDATAGSTNQTCDITINDDDLDPTSMVGPLVTIMTEDFESGLGSFTTVNNAGGAGNDPFAVGNAAAASSTAFTVPNTNATQMAWINDDACNCNQNDVDLISSTIDLTNYVAASLSFDTYYEGNTWSGNSETAIVEISTGGPNSTIFTVPGNTSWSNYTVDLTPYVGNNNVVITFNYSDGTGWLYGWAVDNVTVTGNGPIGIQTAINTGSGMTADLGPNQTVHFYDPGTDNVMMTLENTSSFDYGCVTVEVDGDGTTPTAVQFNSANVADYIHSKTFTVVPTNTNPSGTYNVTLYYEEAEVAAWEAATGNSRTNAEIIKVAGNNSMNDVTPANQGSYTIANSGATVGAFYSDVTFTAPFSTGFSGFGVGIYNPGTVAPVADFAASATSVCAGDQVNFTDNSTNGPTSWAWDFGDGNTSTSQNPNNTYASSGVYTVSLTATNAYGSDTYTSTVTVNALPTVNASATSSSVCSGSSTTLNASGANSYSWDNGAGSGASVTVSPSSTTVYTVTGTDVNGCVNSDMVTITVNPNPTISSTGTSNPSSCGASDGSITIGSSGSGNISWTGTASGSQTGVTLPYTVTGLAAGSYTFTFVDGNGCTSNTVSQSISDPGAPAAPTVTPGTSVSICQGQSATLTSSYTSGNTWSTGASTQSINVTTGGNYDVYYTNGSGCVSGTTTITVTVNSNPTVNAGTDQATCEGTAVTLSATGASTYAWDNGAGSGSSVSVNPTSTTTYTVTGTDGNGCTGTDMVTVTVNPLPTVSITPPVNDTLCVYNSAITLVGSPGSGTFSGTGVSGSTFDPATAGLGTHTITYSYTDGNGCTGTNTIDIYVDACAGLSMVELVDVSLFPDPNEGTFIIKGLEIGTAYTIYDSRGRLVLESNVKAVEEHVTLSVVENGIYYLHSQKDGKEGVIKFLIAK